MSNVSVPGLLQPVSGRHLSKVADMGAPDGTPLFRGFLEGSRGSNGIIRFHTHLVLICRGASPAVGAEADDERIEQLLGELKGRDINEVIASGREKFAAVPGGGGGGAVAVVAGGGGGGGGAAEPAAAEEEKEEEKKEEEKEESDDVSSPPLNTISEAPTLPVMLFRFLSQFQSLRCIL